jgi:hypothetical protein
LERFFGTSKGNLRQSIGCGSTTNSVVANLGAEPLLAYQQLQDPEQGQLLAAGKSTAEEFQRERQRIRDLEQPGIRRRSMTRHLDKHIERLRRAWLGD